MPLENFCVGWRYRLCGERVKLFSDSIISDGPGQQENEFADDMRGWAAHQTILGKTVDILIKEGFDMEALILIDSDVLSQKKIQCRQQKLLLKALLSLQSTGEDTGFVTADGHRGERDAR